MWEAHISISHKIIDFKCFGPSLHYPLPQTSLDAMVQLETRLNIQGEIVFQKCFIVSDLLSELVEILRQIEEVEARQAHRGTAPLGRESHLRQYGFNFNYIFLKIDLYDLSMA